MKKLLILMFLLPLVAFGQTRPHVSQVRPVGTIEELKTINPTVNGTWAFVSGHTSPADGGGGDFVWQAASTAVANDGTVVAPTSGSGRWLRQVGDTIPVSAFGVFPDAGDVSAKVASAVDSVPMGANLKFDKVGVYQMDSPLVISRSIAISGVSAGVPQPEFVGGTQLDFSGSSGGIVIATIYARIHDINILGGVSLANRQLVDPSTQAYGKIGIKVERTAATSGGGDYIKNVGIQSFGTGLLFTHETLGNYSGSYWVVDNVRLRSNGAGVVADSYVTDLRMSNIHNSNNSNHDIWVSSIAGYQNVTFINSVFEGAGGLGNFDFIEEGTAGTWENVGLFIGTRSKVNFITCYFENTKMFVGKTSTIRFSGGHWHPTAVAFGLGEVEGLDSILGHAVTLPLPELHTWTPNNCSIANSSENFEHSDFDPEAYLVSSSATESVVLNSGTLTAPSGVNHGKQALGARGFGVFRVSYKVVSPAVHAISHFTPTMLVPDGTVASPQTQASRDFRGALAYSGEWVDAWAIDVYRRGGSYGTEGLPYTGYRVQISVSSSRYGELDFSTTPLSLIMSQPTLTFYRTP